MIMKKQGQEVGLGETPVVVLHWVAYDQSVVEGSGGIEPQNVRLPVMDVQGVNRFVVSI
jgi:hypothetical protein